MLEELTDYLWIFVQLTVGYNLVVPLLLFLAYCLVKPIRLNSTVHKNGDYAVIVTAFKYTGQLPDVISSILKVNYERYLVYVVADNCDISGLGITDTRVIVLHPEQILASNTKSHLYAIQHFKREHNRITIIDSDNIVHPEFLNEMEKGFKQGFDAVQGRRLAKNLNTTYACLDAARDIYYHFYDGKILFRLGSSATLSGSGMAFTTDIYKSFLDDHNITGAGFDKVLQFALVKKGLRIAFIPEAIVYDEKTAERAQLVNQRSRWIQTWFRYFSFGFTLIYSGLKSLQWNQFLFGIVLLRPPLFIFLILSFTFMLINLLLGSGLAAVLWLFALASFIIGFAIAMANTAVDRKIYRSLTSIPKFIFYQIVSLFKIKTVSKRPPSTHHTYTSKLENTR
ncbi:glycosyltransferase [Daejeonella sp. JGW-45]|uniref:glycosyltransferase n=1 Tax=Daejeonella sp. JGW-45 TaxID=3034148 RepID=UPI0023EB35F9|nr:glycosyltransferase [Daejeonella sp. JGW-45]